MAMLTELTSCDRQGLEYSLYYDTADDPSIAGGSSCTTPTWVIHKGIVGDVTVDETDDEEELNVRDPAQVYKQYVESKSTLSISGEQVVDPLYEGFIYLNAARPKSYARNFLILSGYLTEVGNVGFKGKFRNFDRSHSAPESGPPKQNWKLLPAACVKAGCIITPVKVSVSGTVASYNPGQFAEYSMEELAAKIQSSSIYQSMMRSTAEELFTDVGQLLEFLSEEQVDGLLTSLVEIAPIEPEKKERSATRFKPTKSGIGGFKRSELLAALDEIVKNVL